jgi:hypothetical protein
MALTDIQVEAAKPKDKPYKLADEKGLYPFVAPTGLPSWRMKYRFLGKEKVLTFGAYPEVKLGAARDTRDAARAILRDGRDPGREKKFATAAGAAGFLCEAQDYLRAKPGLTTSDLTPQQHEQATVAKSSPFGRQIVQATTQRRVRRAA